MNKELPVPPIPKELVEYLDQLYPERCPEIGWSDREVWRRTGQREVVRFLLSRFKEQEDNILTRTSNVQNL